MKKFAIAGIVSSALMIVTGTVGSVTICLEAMTNDPETKKKLLKTKIAALGGSTIASFASGFLCAKCSIGVASVFCSAIGCICAHDLYNVIKEGVENGELQI